ncbi:unnamed protein product [Rotaria sp. Silwood2]|nr:unnamed protein product [Rotaria sp. Silwood2]
MFLRNILFLLCFLRSLSAELLIFNIRDNGKICTQWMNWPTGNVSLETNPECVSTVSLEQNNTTAQMRLCCQGMPLTTPAPYFTKECGKQLYTPLGQRIIGGSVVQPHSWPWYVLVHGIDHMCGGTLIDERHVPTAAHCIKQKQVYTVTVGLHSIVGAHFMEQKISTEKIYVHEEYDSVKLSNDIAIIYLSKSVEVTDKINFISLPGSEASIGEKFYTAEVGQCNGGSGGPLMYQDNERW